MPFPILAEAPEFQCPACENPIPEPRQTSYIMETGKQKVWEYVCVFCGTKILVPIVEEY